MNRFFLYYVLMLTMSANAQSTGITFQSANEQTALVELYTSEGCSSCPPAETWLSALKQSKGLWKEFVPVAFHVDYWDYLGWPDPWGNRAYSDRQRAYAGRWGSDNIYTPGFVLNGKEWRDWSRQKDGPKLSKAKAGVLTVTSLDTNRWHVNFAPAMKDDARYEVHAVLLASGVSSDVKAGENRGRHLTHDFAALTMAKATLNSSGSVMDGEFVFSVPPKTPQDNLSVAVWITHAGHLDPLQATGGWIGRSSSVR